MEIHEIYEKSGGKSFQNRFVFSHLFFRTLEPTWVDFGIQVGLQQVCRTQAFSQDNCKRRPRDFQESQGRPKRVSRASQELPTASQEGPRVKSAQERSKRAQGTPKVPPEGHFFEDFLAFNVFLRFSGFSCVFLRFSLFFLCFFTAYPR